MDLETYQRLKKQFDDLQRQADRSRGALDQLKAQLKSDYGCKTLEDAKKRSAALSKEATALEKQFDAESEKFDKKWSEKLQ